MQPTPTAGAHPEDGVLLRLLDGQADDAEQASAGPHAAGCAECRARMDAMVRRRDRLAALLARTDFPVPAASAPEPGVIPLHSRRREAAPSRPWLRAAAIVLVVLGVGVMASPARAWIARWLSEAWESVSGDAQPAPAPAPAAPAPRPAEQTAAAQVGFVPTGAELSVVVAHAQGAGALVVAAAPGASATAEVVGGTGAADLLVLPAALHVRNTPGSAAEYRLSLPSSVRRVRIRVGGGRETVVEMAEVGEAGRRVELSGG